VWRPMVRISGARAPDRYQPREHYERPLLPIFLHFHDEVLAQTSGVIGAFYKAVKVIEYHGRLRGVFRIKEESPGGSFVGSGHKRHSKNYA
jgi:hypothetical protein